MYGNCLSSPFHLLTTKLLFITIMAPIWSLIALTFITWVQLVKGGMPMEKQDDPGKQSDSLLQCPYYPYTPYKYKGCFRQTGRNLHGYNLGSEETSDYGWGILFNSGWTRATPKICISFCKGNLYRYAGVKQNGECFCGTMLEDETELSSGYCNQKCTANKSLRCGGRDSWDIYEDQALADIDEQKALRVKYENLGCWNVEKNYQQMTNAPRRMNPQECIDNCKVGGWPFAMLADGDKCYCNNMIRGKDKTNHGFHSLVESKCNLPCHGDINQTCGAEGGAAEIYYAKDFVTSENCWSNGVELISDYPNVAFDFTRRIALINASQHGDREADEALWKSVPGVPSKEIRKLGPVPLYDIVTVSVPRAELPYTRTPTPTPSTMNIEAAVSKYMAEHYSTLLIVTATSTATPTTMLEPKDEKSN